MFRCAEYIAKKENADIFIVSVAAFLHDIGDRKITGLEDNTLNPCKDFLDSLEIDKEIAKKILNIIENISYSKNIDKKQELSLEGKVVQDADRLDAIGAIGIARCFAYGGKAGKLLYNQKKSLKSIQKTRIKNLSQAR